MAGGNKQALELELAALAEELVAGNGQVHEWAVGDQTGTHSYVIHGQDPANPYSWKVDRVIESGEEPIEEKAIPIKTWLMDFRELPDMPRPLPAISPLDAAVKALVSKAVEAGIGNKHE